MPSPLVTDHRARTPSYYSVERKQHHDHYCLDDHPFVERYFCSLKIFSSLKVSDVLSGDLRRVFIHQSKQENGL